MHTTVEPIHYQLYNKIRLQQSVIDEICILGEKNNLSLEEACNYHYGSFENKPLEEMANCPNIRKWLEDQVMRAEYKYAYCVTRLLNKNPDAMEALKHVLTASGINLAVYLKEHYLDAAAIYQAAADNLLDGVSDEHASKPVKLNKSEAVWTENLSFHKPFWEKAGGDFRVYQELRDTWMDAFVKELGYHYERSFPDICCIRQSVSL